MLLVAFGMHAWFLANVSGISNNIVWKDTALSVFSIGICLWAIILLINAYPTKVAILFYAFVLSVSFGTIVVLTDWTVLSIWLGRKNVAYNIWLHTSIPLRAIIDFLILLVASIYTALKRRAESIELKYKQQADASSLLREAELFKLRQQLQPHFLYNSLNSISALIMIQPEKAQEMIGKLSEFLRSSVKREAQDVIPIAEELSYIESYLAIESVRFGDRLKVIFEREYTDDAKLPPFLLQPILENAVKYGLYGKTGNVTITMHIALKDSMLVITVNNPYDVQTQSGKGTGFGLEGIRRRLYLLYARADLLETAKDEETFTTILKIPQQHV
jgi:sensor histidine kinase YesM